MHTCILVCKYVYISRSIYLREGRVDCRVPRFGVRRSLSWANEIGIEHRTRSRRMTHHTSFWSKLGLDRTRSVQTSKITSKIRNERSGTEHSNAILGFYNKNESCRSYACIYKHTCRSVRMCIREYADVSAYAYMYTCVFVCMCIFRCICLLVYVYKFGYVDVQVYLYIYIRVYMHICSYI